MTSVGAAWKTNKPGYYGKGSVEVSPPTNDLDGPTRRLAISADKLVTQPFATVYDVLQYVAKTHSTRNALGWRDIVDVHEEAKEVVKTVNGKEVKETKKWKYFQLSGYKYITYVWLKDQVDEIARGLVDLGLTTDDVFNIYAATRWVLLFGFRFASCAGRAAGTRRRWGCCALFARSAYGSGTLSSCVRCGVPPSPSPSPPLLLLCSLSMGSTLRFRAARVGMPRDGFVASLARTCPGTWCLLRASCARSAYTYCFPYHPFFRPRCNGAQGCYDYVNANVGCSSGAPYPRCTVLPHLGLRRPAG
ncbi:hypothetical protein B0H16DRAFT_222667 [Mycena metata]|uniref:Uncharacterized protein n=1 Tax=Mycena metata TaxID=1033252 RepID=A0AAD7HYE7_9AGAR|nr:hypothetical protein B0H16DRAFT_222667 [Mycena metata]